MAEQVNHGLIERMVGAARLDVHTYEEVEHDTSATKQAFFVVALVAISTGIASLGAGGPIGLLVGVVIAIAGWALWASIVYLVGTKLLSTPDTHADWGQLARTLGFAQSPGILRVLGIVPGIGGIIFFVVSIWMLMAMVTAVRQALDYKSTWRAFGVVLLGFIPYAILLSIGLALLGQST